MKKLITLIPILILFGLPNLSAQTPQGITITDNGTFPTTAQTLNAVAYWEVTPGKKYAISIKGATFDSGSLDVQENYRIGSAGGEEFASIGEKGAITAAEDFQFVAIGSKIRIVVTSVAASSADIDIIGPIAVAP